MPELTASETMQPDAATPPFPASNLAPRPARTGRRLLILTLLAFVLGVALAGWLAWSGRLDFVLPGRTGAVPAARLANTPAGAPAAAIPPLTAGQQAQAEQQAQSAASFAVGGVETRLALLEDRLARLDLQADAASGNAARAEGLLLAFAARRVVAKGAPLGYLEDQLKLRFGGVQPEAVKTLADFARDPVTLDQLNGGLDALAPALAEQDDAGGWARIKSEFASLLVVRRAAGAALAPRDKIQRARLMLTSGKTGEAIDEVQKLPGARNAAAWTESARRYDSAQQALDLIETAAMLEPRGLQDGEGTAINQSSPLAPPPEAAASAAPTGD